MTTNRRQFLTSTAASALAAATPASSDFSAVRQQFPRATQQVYLDAAANMPLPKYVHDALIFIHSGVSNSVAKFKIAEAVAGYRRSASGKV